MKSKLNRTDMVTIFQGIEVTVLLKKNNVNPDQLTSSEAS